MTDVVTKEVALPRSKWRTDSLVPGEDYAVSVEQGPSGSDLVFRRNHLLGRHGFWFALHRVPANDSFWNTLGVKAADVMLTTCQIRFEQEEVIMTFELQPKYTAALAA